MKFKGIVPVKKPAVKIGAAAAAAVMMIYEVILGQYIYIPIGLLVILACFYQKEHIVSEEGVDIKSSLFGFTTHSCWTWDEITAIRTDRQKARPNVHMHIAKDVTIRLFTMTPADCLGVLELARRMNPDVYIKDVTAEDQEERDRQVLHQQDVERARRAAQKRKK